MAEHFYRKIIRIRAEDSPNVRLAFAEGATLEHPEVASGTVICPGCLTWDDYVKRRRTWDAVRQCIGLDGQFYEGSQVLMFPPQWLDRAEAIHEKGKASGRKRQARSIGIDPAEGGDRTAMSAVDEWGLIELVSKKTPNTAVITGEAIAFADRHGLINNPEKWVFDRGGGGKQHADRLREQGFKGVRTVAFGEQVTLDPKRGLRPLEQKLDNKEERYAFFNRRAEMYGILMELLDPDGRTIFEMMHGATTTMHAGGSNGRIGANGQLSGGHNPNQGWGIPSSLYGQVYGELRRQLAPIPKTYDPEGRLKLLPKNKRSADSEEKTLTELIGCSPDEADAVVLAVYGMVNRSKRMIAGAAV